MDTIVKKIADNRDQGTQISVPSIEEIKKGYGPHLTYDGYNCPTDPLNNMQLVFQFLSKMPEVLGMHKLTQPYTLFYDGGGIAEDYGVTGVVIIAESHISIHTYPHDKTFFLDVFSCRPFDVEKTLTFVRETFKAEKEDINVVVRGKSFRQN